MRVIEAQESDKDAWNDFVARNSSPSVFLQSFEWGEYQQQLGRKVFRLAVVNSKFQIPNHKQIPNSKSQIIDIIAVTHVVRMPLPLGRSWLYSPRGPIIKFQIPNSKSQTNSKFQIPNHKQIYEILIQKIREIGSEENAVWWRVEPAARQSEVKIEKSKVLDKCELGFGEARVLKSFAQPRQTLLVDLSLSEEYLLKRMHQKTRYNIRLAGGKGVVINGTRCEKQDTNKSKITNSKQIPDSKFDEFYSLMQETGRRDGIKVYPRKYYEKLFSCISSGKGDGEGVMEAELIWAEYGGKMAAANILVHFGDTTTYLYGASSNEHRNVMAPHLLQWESVRLAKERGSEWYDFWGIESSQKSAGKSQKSWAGITRYKLGFVSLDLDSPSGREISYVGAYDLPINRMWYKLYDLFGTLF